VRAAFGSADPDSRYPITGIAGCCARAAKGHATAPPRVFCLYFDTDGTSLKLRDYSNATVRLLANAGHGSDVSLGSDGLLNQVSVLIVENEPFIALDLAEAVKEARGKVIGPAGSVREALALIEQNLVQVAVQRPPALAT
jgi:hypothetical protein